ncbi:LIM/homeobox protein Lhx3-like isoform X1 [Zootermopsis nevadensis]|uniref:LIM/homeobox protein Lhx3-like isoform X1 n=1 Tax=Zootermopsis nevadensis TaxID=136037 RepID=UPI000B8ECBB9|nr:LIM/homeobox protein Lhx3-like isoform X1 [Zootermopsis nevadensis]XP_021913826.1 LIM/homeobox protein Lhx3-like isoform X1 [Zootermopsis nevadensis]XP_021913835.1 LIM/homeobox protein Lhx3-like isoform X1 [Zootermopsis nevadensis]XP_021913843.1 LIM/homeobox protein Lhx3-like isoform X1 [Zootermopsis nevadensis]XP_021913852.1 LIM/homeobox protein Lhx3-like isoform X1 [Zootermopsis nevadensis]XP_021913862.1 LIM/homeobox protein Lhx3-like isoform X1 [Zootermopsis nevadensis]XP_021913873.1 LI
MHNTDNGTDQGAGDHQTPSGRTAVSVQGAGTTAASSAVASAANTASSVGGPRECAGCGKRITERYLLKALDMYWHEDCLKCGCCDCRLGEVGSTLYTKANLILCKRDYLRLFGATGYCAACSKVIPAFEMVMRAKSNVYHLECFACQQCNHRFCVGDRFYLCDNKILCEYDYEERLVFASMAYNASSLAHIRRQVSNLQPAGDNLNIAYENPRLLHQQYHHHHHHHHHHHQQLTPTSFFPNDKTPMLVTPASGGGGAGQQLRDDGSSGYGSPDSETFDAQCN